VPENNTLEQQRENQSTQAGEFVREEMYHVRESKHGARSTKQATAIGLSKARRAGVTLAAPKKGKTSAEMRRKAGARSPQGLDCAREGPLSEMLARGLRRTQAGTSLCCI
jgi:hypothetical protein